MVDESHGLSKLFPPLIHINYLTIQTSQPPPSFPGAKGVVDESRSTPSHSINHPIGIFLLLKTPNDFLYHATNSSLCLPIPSTFQSFFIFFSFLTDLNKPSFQPLNQPPIFSKLTVDSEVDERRQRGGVLEVDTALVAS